MTSALAEQLRLVESLRAQLKERGAGDYPEDDHDVLAKMVPDVEALCVTVEQASVRRKLAALRRAGLAQ